MIVAMKKITLVCLAGDRERSLSELGRLGVLHLVPVTEPQGEDLARTERELARAQAALNVLTQEAAKTKGAAAPRPASDAEGGEILSRLESLIARRKELHERLESLRREREAIEPLGEFDPGLVEQLRRRNVTVKFCRAAGRKPVVPPAGAVLLPLREDAAGRYFALIGCGEIACAAEELPAPRRRLSEVDRDAAAAEADLQAADGEVLALAGSTPALAAHLRELDDRRSFLAAREGMGREGALAWLQGFCPADAVEAVRRAAATCGWGLRIGDPAAAERVPTLIRNPAWIRPIESLFRLIRILPGYREVDVSASFLLFLSLFFAMIVGDAGYGLVFLAGTLILRRRLRKAPPEPFRLLYIFSACTILWGVLTGTYFAIGHLPAPLQRLRVDWLTDNKNIMALCLFIGAVHLTVAHAWNVVRMCNTLPAIAQAGWIAVTWSLYFAARMLLLEAPLPACFWPLLGLGLAYVILFMTPRARLRHEWVNHALLPLTIMSNLGDVLSYLRLFALGVAGVQLGGAFNAMARSLGFGRPLAGLLAALILFVGHTLNVGLSAISVLVHGIRLNALEFSMHFGLEWAGVPYQPFAKRGRGTASAPPRP